MSVPVDLLVCGEAYHVALSDCCVEGEFTSMLISVDYEESEPVSLAFSNGVRLNRFWQVTFEEVT